MYVLLDTSAPVCRVSIVDEGRMYEYEWEAGRTLAQGLLGFLVRTLGKHDTTLDGVRGVGVYQGPGSFTGLRIGLTVANTLADDRQIAIVGATGDGWQAQVVARLEAGEDDRLVMPLYGRDARITQPRK